MHNWKIYDAKAAIQCIKKINNKNYKIFLKI